MAPMTAARSDRGKPLLPAADRDPAGQPGRALAAPARDQRVQRGDVPVRQGARRARPAPAPRRAAPGCAPPRASPASAGTASPPSGCRAAARASAASSSSAALSAATSARGAGQVVDHPAPERRPPAPAARSRAPGPGRTRGRCCAGPATASARARRRRRRVWSRPSRSSGRSQRDPVQLPAGRHPGQPARAGAPGQREQHGLGLVVAGVAEQHRDAPVPRGPPRPAPRSGRRGRPPPGRPGGRPPRPAAPRPARTRPRRAQSATASAALGRARAAARGRP